MCCPRSRWVGFELLFGLENFQTMHLLTFRENYMCLFWVVVQRALPCCRECWVLLCHAYLSHFALFFFAYMVISFFLMLAVSYFCFWFSIAPKMYIEISVAVFREMSYYVGIICFCYVPGYLIIVLNIEKGQK